MAKRVNTKFLIGLTVVVVGMALAAFVLFKVINRHDPKKWIQAGDRAFAEKRWANAAENYRQGLVRDPNNKELRVKWGDALAELGESDPEQLQNARTVWHQVVEMDPRYSPALQKLLDSYWEDLEFGGRIDGFRRAAEVAKKLIVINPNDAAAHARLQVLTVRQWLGGAPVDLKEVDESVKALAALQRANPQDVDAMYYLGEAKLRRAADQLRSSTGDRDEAKRLVAEVAEMADKVSASEGKDAQMQSRAYLLYNNLAAIDPDAMAGQDQEAGKPRKTKYDDRIERTLAAAQAAASTDNPKQYLDIRVMAVNARIYRREPKEAEKILQQTIADLKGKPEENRARIAYARGLKLFPEYRDKSIAILEQAQGPSTQPENASQSKDTRGRALVELTDLRAEAFFNTQDAAKKKELKEKVDEGYKKISVNIPPESYEGRRLAGTVNMVDGNLVGAISNLSKAWDLSKNRNDRDYLLADRLAALYMQANQTGEAKDLLQELTQRFPDYLPPHILLAQILLREQNPQAAKVQIEEIEKRDPANTALPAMKMLLVGLRNPAGNGGTVNRVEFDKLPEDTAAQRIGKARIAFAMSLPDEAKRIAKLVHDEDQKNLPAIEILVIIALQADQKEEALQYVREALKAYPGNKSLLVQEAKLKGATPAELMALRRELIEKNPDPFEKELLLADLDNESGKYADALQHVKAADKQKQNDPIVMTRFLEVYTRMGDFDHAAAYLEPLAKANADMAGGLVFRYKFALAKGDLNQALALGGELTSKYGDFAESWVDFGDALKAAGRYDEAAEKYETALTKQSNNRNAIVGLIDCYTQLNQTDSVRKWLNEGRKLFPSDRAMQDRLLRFEVSSGNPEKAIAEREKLLKEQPGWLDNALQLAAACVRTSQTKYPRGTEKSNQMLARAREVLTATIAKTPSSGLYSALAKVMELGGDVAGAESLLKEYAAKPEMKDRGDALVMLAEHYSRNNKADLAEQALKEALTQTKNDPAVRQQYAGFLAQHGRPDDAIKALDGVSTPGAARQRIDIMMAANRNADSERIINDELKKDPKNKDLLTLLVRVYLDSSKFDEATDAIKRLADADPKGDGPAYWAAFVKYRKGDAPGAARDLDVILQANSRNVDARVLKAEALSSTNIDEAISEMIKALQAVPNNSLLRLKLMDFHLNASPPQWNEVLKLATEAEANPTLAADPIWPRREAMVYAQMGNANKAIAKIQDAISLAPDNRDLIADYYSLLLRKKDYATILKETEGPASSGKAEWWMYQARGMAKAAQKDPAGATAEFDKALAAVDPQKDFAKADPMIQSIAGSLGYDDAIARVQKWAPANPHWQLVLAGLYQQKEDWPNAIKAIETLLGGTKLSPEDRMAVLRTGALMYQMTKPPQFDKAADLYREVLKKTPDDIATLNNLAYILVDAVSSPKPQEAKNYSKRAYDLANKGPRINPGISDTHGWVLLHCGGKDRDEGIRILSQVAEQAPFPEAYYHLAEGYLMQSKPQDAQAKLKAATDLIEQYKKANRPVDKELEERIRSAGAKASQALGRTDGAAP